MHISANTVVTIDYTLKDDEGQVIDSSEGGEALAYLHGANNIVVGLETALEGKKAGESVSVKVPPEEGYGVPDAAKVQNLPKEMFSEAGEVVVGAQYYAMGPDGQPLTLTVLEIEDAHILVDANHPLAGQNLNFDVTIVDVREATEEELSHGHVHGPDGHEHDHDQNHDHG